MEKRSVYTCIVMLTLAMHITSAQSDTYNLEVDLPPKYLEINAGEKIFFTTKIINLANLDRKDIILEYSILHKEKTIVTKKETVAIETQASFVGSILLPEQTKTGTHKLTVNIVDEHGNKISESQREFTITPKQNTLTQITKHWKITLPISLVIILGLLLLLTRKKITHHLQLRNLHTQIKNIIKNKLQKGKITQQDLENSHLPGEEPTPTNNPEEKKIY